MASLARASPEHTGQIKPTPQAALQLPSEGFVRLPQVLAVLPVSPAHFWEGIRLGIFPAGVSLSPKVTCWAVEDVRRAIQYYKERAGWKPWEPPAPAEKRELPQQ